MKNFARNQPEIASNRDCMGGLFFQHVDGPICSAGETDSQPPSIPTWTGFV